MTSSTDEPQQIEGETNHTGGSHGGHGGEASRYLRFGAMIATSTVVMFALTYTNSYAFGHVRWSEERLYMALLMGGAMSVIMLGFMWSMHTNTKVNVAIVLASVALMGVALYLSRSQRFVDDREYMKGMIPPPQHRHPHERARRHRRRSGL